MGRTTEKSGFDYQQEKESLLFSIRYRLALGPIKPPIQGYWEPYARDKEEESES
jgi:hypothetical protein